MQQHWRRVLPSIQNDCLLCMNPPCERTGPRRSLCGRAGCGQMDTAGLWEDMGILLGAVAALLAVLAATRGRLTVLPGASAAREVDMPASRPVTKGFQYRLCEIVWTRTQHQC